MATELASISLHDHCTTGILREHGMIGSLITAKGFRHKRVDQLNWH